MRAVPIPVRTAGELMITSGGPVLLFLGGADEGEVGNFAPAGHRTTHGARLNPIAELDPG